MESLIDIRGLDVRFDLKEGTIRAVNGINLALPAQRTMGIVGESGCGKSIMARAILGILPPRGRITAGRIMLAPRNGAGSPIDLAQLPPSSRAMRKIRGAEIAMIFQEPMTSLSPVHTVGNQIMEGIRLHQPVSKAEARDRAVEMLRLAGIPMAERRVDAYPHELSGGLRQRCMIAMALSCRPRLLIADEPTTALDVTIQAQILDLIGRLQQELGMAVMMITHDLGVIAETADEVAVMYLGRIVEQAPVDGIFDNPLHPYTKGLLASIPRIGRGNASRLSSIPGSLPDPFTIPAGCAFHPRCAQAIRGVCDAGNPPHPRSVGPEHRVACHLYHDEEIN
ncbi:MAG TPA: ABC transporter ATP-binding protein [Candidatus Hydrogenedentes bacterium]|nr:ABC transporter ATP-binding protein [Candidatus Hydrogenedentota bacterium]HPC17705.1 ABC transporter ATP-binding protein [Candidatus Hydrogenedentota bacterium]HRT21085.1 ABC transporter ATP-binding protein [Candidatus Hydrogenedentota bacterium]HRT66042.1 ABC transporter ATP-binding protein [Candidatus Hydrogenedentota bacterium]